MKMRFKPNPLGVAVVAILCTPITAYATTDTSAPVSTEKYDGQQFFERYYVKSYVKPYVPPVEEDKQPLTAQSATVSNSTITNNKTNNHQPTRHFNRFCQGTWATPIDRDASVTDVNKSESQVQADYLYYHPAGQSELSGNVLLSQQGRQIRADKLLLDASQTHAQAEGQVELAQKGIVVQSDTLNYNLKQQTGEFKNSYYISEQTHAHGKASRIERPNDTQLILHDASYSACAPSESPTWKIKAKKIEINEETGRGITRDTKLYIKNTPVLSVPYFNFPIDDRRATGLLTPNFGYTNDGGVQFSTPIYLNLAPNYDATLSPRYLSERGAMLDGQFRYLTANFGQGQLSGGYLYSDSKYNHEDRKSLAYQHNWQINPQWSTFVTYNYASDKDYFSDLSSDVNTRTDLNLRRAWQINYRPSNELSAQLKAESFQTLDKEVLDINRPYARLPQLLIDYVGGNPQGWQYEYHNETAYFKKNVSNRRSIENNGTRLYNDVTVRYNFKRPYAFVIPSVSARSIHTWYDTTYDQQGQARYKSSVVVPQFTLDTGLMFEKQGEYLQTISPRLFYAYAPYKDQSNHPIFDTKSAPLNYDQLFSPNRFYGRDRLDDNNFVSLGLNYRLFNEKGLELLKAGIAQSFFFEDRQVSVVKDVKTDKRTGAMISLSSQLNDQISVSANSAWTPDGDNKHNDIQFYYTGDTGNLYNVGYYYRNDILGSQAKYHQTVLSVVQPIQDQWRVMLHAQYDLDNDLMRDMLFGVNYESCCWAVSVYGRSYYNDLDNILDSSVKPNNAVMAEFTLKGLGSLNNKLTTLLENKVVGFDKTNQYWTTY